MKKASLFLFILFVAANNIMSQNSLLPVDSAVRKGVLSNGLTYYIRHNELPKERAEFHIAQNVGAILENDNQNGLAHFLEHMAFNGSEHFHEKGIINYFESIGVNFGGNINAYTSLDKTVYRLSEVPTYREGIVDTALLTLYDWSCALTLADKEIDAERGVILEEWRTRANAARRMWKASSALKYAGSQYAKRDVIGDTAIILHFEHQALKDYYKKWYGPDLQAIVVVGDIDVEQIEKKIVDLFGKIPPRINRGERPIYYLKEQNEPVISIVTDKEAQNSRLTLEFVKKTSDDEFKLSEKGYRFFIKNNLFSQIFTYRFEEQKLNPDANFLDAGIYYHKITKGNEALIAAVIAKEGKEKAALKDLYSEIIKTLQHGFGNAELERAKADMESSFEKSFNERNSRRNIGLTEEYIRNFLEAEAIPGIEWEYGYVKRSLAQISLEELNAHFNSLFEGSKLIVDLQAPEKDGVDLPDNAEIFSIFKEVENSEFDAPKEETAAKNLVDKLPKAGKIKKITQNASLGTTEWLLSNGVKVVFKPTEFKKDEILLNAFSWGGLNSVATADLPSAKIASDAREYSGLGKFSSTDLTKILTGKTVSVEYDISNTTENINGMASVKDFETMLQLVYLGFGEPRKDENAFRSLFDLYKNWITNREKNPKEIFADSLSTIWTARDERTILFNNDFLQKVDYQKSLEIIKQRFAAANDFTFIFTGNINPDAQNTQKLICRWLGGLKKGATEEYAPQENRHPQGKVVKYFSTKMEIDNSTNVVRYYSPMDYNWENSVNMNVLGKILDIRYMESVRESEGGSYGVGVYGRVEKLPEAEGLLHIRFDCNPEKTARLLDIIHAEINKILTDGVRADDLQKVKESLLKDFDENLAKNNYWSSVLATYYTFGRNYIADYKNAVTAVTAATVQNTLKKLAESGNVFQISMGKEK
jgi:zinc protease